MHDFTGWYILDENDDPQPTWLIRRDPITGETHYNHAFNEWMFGKDKNRIILQSTVPGVGDVSTVFLGLDHNFFRHGGPPVLFESMIFCINTDDDLHNWQHRYCTKAESIVGHGIVLLLAQGNITDDEAHDLLSKAKTLHD